MDILSILTFKIIKMPLVSALRAWLAMVNPMALAPGTRLEIAIVDGRLDVVEMKKPEKVSQILTNERYQPKIRLRYAHLDKNCPSWLNGLIL